MMIATLLGVLAIIMWSCLALLGVNTSSIPAFQLLSLCFSLSALFMFFKRLLLKQALLTKPTLSIQQWLVGIMGLFGFHYCYFMALKLAPAIEVSLISYLWPMLLAICIATKQTLFKTLLGGIIGFIGVSVIIMGEASISYNAAYLKGYVLAGCCAVLWAGYSWYFSRSNNSIDDIGWVSLAVALLSLLAHIQLETSHWQFSHKELLGLLFLGLGPVGGAFYLWDYALKKGNKKLLASLSFCTPLISSIILAVMGLNHWSENILISLSLILAGALISNISIKPTAASIKHLLKRVFSTTPNIT